MKKYFELDENGRYNKIYSRPQPGKNLTYLEEPGNDYSIWNGTSWEIDLTKYKKIKRDELKEIIKSNWLEINKTMDEIKAQYSVYVSNSASWTSKASVDVAFDNAILWLGL